MHANSTPHKSTPLPRAWENHHVPDTAAGLDSIPMPGMLREIAARHQGESAPEDKAARRVAIWSVVVLDNGEALHKEIVLTPRGRARCTDCWLR